MKNGGKIEVSAPPKYNPYFTTKLHENKAEKACKNYSYKEGCRNEATEHKKEQTDLHIQIVQNISNEKLSADTKTLVAGGQIKGDLRMRTKVNIFN
jgi:hypothetical protein